MAGSTELDAKRLLPYLVASLRTRKREDILVKFSRLSGRSIFSLLNEFRSMDCKHSRDRVFSLLALCSEASQVTVNYTSSLHTLAGDILRACKGETFCLCSIRILTLALDISDAEPSDVQYEQPFASLTLALGGATPFFRRPPSSKVAPGDHDDIVKVTIDSGHMCSTVRKTIRFVFTYGSEHNYLAPVEALLDRPEPGHGG